MAGSDQTVAFLTWLAQDALDAVAARAAKAGHVILPTIAVTPTPQGYAIGIEVQLSNETAAALVAEELTV